ncbi:MAG: DUF4132 domain-containing protein [Ruminococcus sp.]|nr:DUF4132 domain-containing protein [Ruminococcus sp.]
MLFAQGYRSFQKLAKALGGYGIESAVIDIALEYLDISKERDNTLLDRIPRYNLSDNSGLLYELEKAVKSEIMSARSEELRERYMLLSEALTGSKVLDLIGIIYDYAIIKHEKEIVKALSSRYGDKAEACYYAIYKSQPYYRSDKNIIKSPEICLDAVEFADRPEIKALLCAKALNQIPEQEKNNPIALKAVRYIKDIKEMSDYYIMAVGEGAYFDDELRTIFRNNVKKYNFHVVLKIVLPELLDVSKILNLIINTPECITTEYIKSMATDFLKDDISECIMKHFETLALNYTDIYRNTLDSVQDIKVANNMHEILIRVKPDCDIDKNALKERIQRTVSKNFVECFKDKNSHDDIRKYLLKGGNFYDIKPAVESTIIEFREFNCIGYIEAFGLDDFMKRIITVVTFMKSWNNFYFIRNWMDFRIEDSPEEFIDILSETLGNSTEVLRKVSGTIDDSYQSTSMYEKFSQALSKRIADFENINVSDMSVSARWIYVKAFALADREKYKPQILAMVGDTSKKVREAVIDSISIAWYDDIVGLLQSKKIGVREVAVSVIEKNNDGSYREELGKAFDKEKSEKLKSRIAVLIGAGTTETTEKSAKVDIITTLVKGSKGKKVAFLFENPYKTVHFTDGTEVPENYLKALLIIYSDMTSVKINDTAKELAGKINQAELNDFTVDVFRRWADKGASAKTKWVMWFCGVHGGHGMIETLLKYIKEWSENSRGAIASEAVMAMAVNGSSEALINVDSIARKFRHKQVRNSADKALKDVAEILGITKEELADKIVPDMHFDDKMCRVFDYGNRQFSVYLTPALEIEIFNGDKKLKNLPKPSKSDDLTKAVQAYEDFKIMKKQIKTVVANQKQRLEYVLMCDRKWNSEDWTKLFVKNPVMHCFVIGLIWGVYDGNRLVESFRYMDDGSFTNIEEDEFEIPENAEIGLVHPIELTSEQKKLWAEQLSDYEIIQPFPQISRPCFTPTEQELTSDEIIRFDGIGVNGTTLRGKLTKSGWETGTPLDAGYFCEFFRNDIIKCVKNPDGTVSYDGYSAEIEFSGMNIQYIEAENVTLGKLTFENYYSDKKLKIKDVNLRYFSEIILQLSSLGNAYETKE